MKSLSEVLQTAEMQELVSKSKIAPKPYKGTGKPPPILYGKARFKLQVWFLDGGRTTRYSTDWIEQRTGLYIHDEWNGLMKLNRLIEKKWSGKIKTAEIYCHSKIEPIYSQMNYDYHVLSFDQWNGTVWNELNSFRQKGQNWLFNIHKFEIANNAIL